MAFTRIATRLGEREHRAATKSGKHVATSLEVRISLGAPYFHR